MGYALATYDIEDDAARFQRTGLAAEGPFAMQRLRPDGRLLAWRLLVPGGISWLHPWPFLIQWDTPDAERLTWESPGQHVNSAVGVRGIAVVVSDLDSGGGLYENQLHLTRLDEEEPADELGAKRTSFAVGNCTIDLLAPEGPGPVEEALADSGEGPFSVTLAVRDLQRARHVLAEAGIETETTGTMGAALAIPPEEALGARLLFIESGG